jgi:hypothetical protein
MPIVITLDGTDDPEEVRAIGRFLSGYLRRDALTPTAVPYGSPAPQADVAWGFADQNALAKNAYADLASPPATQPSDDEIDAAVAAAARSAGLQGETGELNEPSVDDAAAVLTAAQMQYTLTTDQVAAPIPPPPAVELDAKGQPWDPELHAASKAKVRDGTWRMRRNTSGIELPPVVTGIIPPPPSADAPAPVLAAADPAKALIERITQHLTNDPTQAGVVLAAVQSVGLTKGFPQLTERPDLVPALIEELGWGEPT